MKTANGKELTLAQKKAMSNFVVQSLRSQLGRLKRELPKDSELLSPVRPILAEIEEKLVQIHRFLLPIDVFVAWGEKKLWFWDKGALWLLPNEKTGVKDFVRFRMGQARYTQLNIEWCSGAKLTAEGMQSDIMQSFLDQPPRRTKKLRL